MMDEKQVNNTRWAKAMRVLRRRSTLMAVVIFSQTKSHGSVSSERAPMRQNEKLPLFRLILLY